MKKFSLYCIIFGVYTAVSMERDGSSAHYGGYPDEEFRQLVGNFFYYSKEGVTENKIDPTEAERKIAHIVNKVRQPKQMEQIIIPHNINTQENSWCDVPGCTAKITLYIHSVAHKAWHERTRYFRCEDCQLAFKRIREYDIHMKTHNA